MPFSLTKLPDQPIIIGAYTGIVRCQDIKDATKGALELLQTDEAVITKHWKYYIVDVRALDMDFAELSCIIDYELQGYPGTFTDPYAFSVMVGTKLIIRAFQKIMNQKGVDASALAIYLRIEDAYAAVQAHIAAHSSA